MDLENSIYKHNNNLNYKCKKIIHNIKERLLIWEQIKKKYNKRLMKSISKN